MGKKFAPGSRQLSMNLPSNGGPSSVQGNDRVRSLIDQRTAQVREQAVKRVISSGIFCVDKGGDKKK